MIKKIDYLISDLKLAKMMGNTGKQLVNNEWQIDTTVEKINKLYEYLLGLKKISI